MRKCSVLVVLATLGCGAITQPDQSPGALSSPIVTADARCTGLLDTPEAKCVLTFSDVVLTISGTGHAVATTGSTVSQFTLPFEGGLLDAVVHYTSYEGAPLILFGVTDGDGGWGGVVRLQRPEFKVAWHLKIPAFNVGAGILEGSSLFVSGIGFIGRIDVQSGKYIWKHEGLYEKRDQAFNSFDAPVVTSTEVLFRESDSSDIRRPLKVIRAQKESGEMSVETW